MSLPAASIMTSPPARVNVAVGTGTRYGVSLVCAASAGVHAALVPEHYREAGPLLAVAFAVSAVALTAAALLVRNPRTSLRAARGTVVVLCGIAACYLLSRTSGLPALVPETEPFDALGVVTTAAEVLAAAAVVRLLLLRKEQR